MLALCVWDKEALSLLCFLGHLPRDHSWHICTLLASDVSAHLLLHGLLEILDNPATLLNMYRCALLLWNSLCDSSAFGCWFVNTFLLGDKFLHWLSYWYANILGHLPAYWLGDCSADLTRNLAAVILPSTFLFSCSTEVAVLARKTFFFCARTGKRGTAGVTNWTEDALFSWGTFCLGAGTFVKRCVAVAGNVWRVVCRSLRKV